MKVGKYLRKTWAPVAYHALASLLPLARRVMPRGPLPPVQHGPAGGPVPLLLFAAADAVYFERYGRSFIGSLRHNASQAGIHIHLFNPAPGQLDQLATLAAGSSPHLTYSWENVDLAHLDEEHRGRYYYSVRFVRLAEECAARTVPCWCLDIDALLVRPIECMLSGVSDSDLAFYARFDKFGANTKLLAGTLYARPVPDTRRLLADIAARIRSFAQQGWLMEKLDQLVIYDCFSRLRRRSGALRFRPFDANVIDLRFTPGGIVWYPKGGSKHDDRYAARVAAYEAEFDRLASSV